MSAVRHPSTIVATPLTIGSWPIGAVRAIASVALGLVITFSADHSASFGLFCFGVFAVVSGAVLAASALRTAAPVRWLFLAHGVLSVLAGIAAFVLPAPGLAQLVLVLGGWALATGALELIAGLLRRRRESAARDWSIAGVLTLVLGVVMFAFPAGFVQHYQVADSKTGEVVTGDVTATIMLVGLLGAWAVLVGVLFAISAVSLRGEARRSTS